MSLRRGIDCTVGRDLSIGSREGRAKKIERRWTGALLGLVTDSFELEQNVLVAVDYQ